MITKLERVDANINISIQLCNYTHASSAPADERERCVFKSLSTDLHTLTLTVVPLYPVTLSASTKPYSSFVAPPLSFPLPPNSFPKNCHLS